MNAEGRVGLMGFEELVTDAMAAPVQGWDFSWLGDRRTDVDQLAWRWFDLIAAAVRATSARSLVDMGTGGGEVLAGYLAEGPRPDIVWATEAWRPNVSVAAATLRPLGVGVLADEGAVDNNTYAGPGTGRGRLAFHDVDVIVNRHEAYAPDEVLAVLSPGGRFLTQQVGGENETEWSEWFGRPGEHTGEGWGRAEAVAQAASAGFTVLDSGEAFPRSSFADVGAVVYYHRLIPWFVPGFDPTGADEPMLRALHERIEAEGSIVLRGHRFWLSGTRS
jgi:hypothetical protein